jgi:pimeloyl-ACP methyl ester carboxylesterase
VFTHRCTGYIILRGSSSFSDWNTNLFSDLTTDTYPHLDTKPQIQVGSARPARHTGFAIAWGSIAPPLEAWVRDQLRHGRMDKIVLSGHSLGGALAVLGAHHFARHDICPVHAVVTFGAPKVGGLDFKSEYEHPRLGLKDRTLHIESAEDIVAIVSKRSDDQHVGHAWTFKKPPLRPSWQMMLLAPMVDAEQATKKKVQRIEKKQQANAAQAKRPSPTGTSNSRQVQERTWTLLFLGLAFKALSFVTKLFARMLAAHSVEHRYGLFISTLSYQRIRRHHEELAALKCRQSGNQENKRIAVESAYAAANTDLAHHLKVSRGRNPRTFRHLANRPIRIETPSKLAEYKNKYTNYIA